MFSLYGHAVVRFTEAPFIGIFIVISFFGQQLTDAVLFCSILLINLVFPLPSGFEANSTNRVTPRQCKYFDTFCLNTCSESVSFEENTFCTKLLSEKQP